MISGINKIYFESDKKASALLSDCFRELGKEPVSCTAASGDAFVSDKKKKKKISKTFGAGVCDMESASIAHVCYVNDTPFVISRVISDGADDDAKYDFPAMCSMAADISSKAVLQFIKKYGG
jgi:adenosylhomocysteine nucleosidase